jgi:hypothetical protein
MGGSQESGSRWTDACLARGYKHAFSVALAVHATVSVFGKEAEMRSILKRLAVAAMSLGALVLAGGAHVRL